MTYRHKNSRLLVWATALTMLLGTLLYLAFNNSRQGVPGQASRISPEGRTSSAPSETADSGQEAEPPAASAQKSSQHPLNNRDFALIEAGNSAALSSGHIAHAGVGHSQISKAMPGHTGPETHQAQQFWEGLPQEWKNVFTNSAGAASLVAHPYYDFSAITGLSNKNSKIKNLSPVARLENLEVLHLNMPDITDVKPLAGLKALRELSIGAAGKLTDLTPLASLNQMEHLYCFRSPVSSLGFAENMAKLKTLWVFGTEISDLSPISQSRSLVYLDIHDTPVTSLSAVKGLDKLRILYIDNTAINSLEPVAGLKSLRYLYLSGTEVKSLEPLRELKHLKKLDIGHTAITSIEPLFVLPNLKELRCVNVPVPEWQFIELKKRNPGCRVFR